MEQSVSHVSRAGTILKIAVALLIGLAGLTVVGVDSAFAAAGPPTLTSIGLAGTVCGTSTQTTGLSGTANGGTALQVCGTNFGAKNATTTTATVGGVAASVTVNSNTSMTLFIPFAHSSTATAPIIITNTLLTSSTTSTCTTTAAPGPPCQYNYTWAAPTVAATGLAPATVGASTGAGSPVTVTATGTWTVGQEVSLSGFAKLPTAIYTILTAGTNTFTVAFSGTLLASDSGLVSPTPAGAIGPIAGGTSVVLSGTSFAGATSVKFGSTSTTNFTVNSATQLTVTAPIGSAGPVNVTVTNPNSTSATTTPADLFTYVTTPTVTGVSGVANPPTGPTGGGTQVTVNGTSFTGVTAVKFGTVNATSFLVNGLNSINAVSPPGTAGTSVDVTVVEGGVSSAPNANDKFAYSATIAAADGTASYSNSPGQDVPVTGTSQAGGAGTAVTISAIGVWLKGTQVALSGFTNGLTAGTYTIATGATGSFTVPFTGTATGSGTGTVLIPNTDTPASVKAVSQAGGAGTAVTISSPGAWAAGQQVYLTGFTNGLTTGNYTLASGTSGSFTVPFAGTVTPCSTTGTACSTADTILAYQAQSFNAASLVTGGGVIDPSTLSVTAQPASGHVNVVSGQLVYFPAQGTPTSYLNGTTTVWETSVTTTGTQTATFQICDAAPNQSTCATGHISYVPGTTGGFVGNQLSAGGLLVSVVQDTGSGIVVPATAASGSTFTAITAPPMAALPATNSNFTVAGIGGYQSITPVPAGVTLVPGSLAVSGGDPATTGKFTATLCDTSVYIAGTCTANTTGNFKTSGAYIETSLNVGTLVPGGSQLSLPTVTSQWTVTAAAGATINSVETEFVVSTNVVSLGALALDAYPSDLASYLNQGSGAPIPAYAAPSPRWSVSVVAGGPTAPAITSANATTFTVGTAGTFSVTTTGSPNAAITKTGTLPSGVTLTDNGNGTATLAGTPAAGTATSYPIVITANNGVNPNATQNFTLTVNQAPAITSANATTFTLGTAGTFSVTTTGSPNAAITKTGALPSGVTLTDNGNGTATLAGTPAAGTTGTYPIVITANNGVTPNATQNFTLTVSTAPTAPLITSANATAFKVGTAGTFSVTTSGNPVPAITETGTLPSGVTLTDNGNGTATLAGTPAAGTGGTSTITITANNGINPNATQSFTLTVNQAPAITSPSSTSFVMASAGTFTVTASGFPSSSFTETGALPSGVTLTTGGVLAGTPIIGSNGTYPIVITANNGITPNATQNFTLTVTTAPTAPTITSAGATAFKVGTAGTFSVTTTGNPAPAITETGPLPSGVTLTDNSNGTATLAGTPAAGTGGIYPLTITANNGVSPNATQSFNLTVNQVPAITSANATTFAVGTAGTFSVTTTGSPTAAITETGPLPSGVTLTDNGNGTATLAGTPAAGTGGTYPITITANNGVTPNATQSFTLSVTAPPTAPIVTSANATTFTVGTAGTFAVTATGYPIPAFTETGPLPSGVTLTDNGNGTATLAGTPAAGTANSYPIVITANNGVTPNGTQNFTLTVHQAPAITSANATTFAVGTAGSFSVTTTGSPTAAITETGPLPSGVTLTDNGNGTATLAGTPAAGTGGTYPITITANNGITPNATQPFTLTVGQAPTITSANATTFTVGTAGTFSVTTTGTPHAAITETGPLPSGVTLTDNGNGTATLAGTPGAGTAGSYPITITANNGITPNATQSFTLTVHQHPAITSAATTTFPIGTPGTFTVTSTGSPVAALSETGTLPSAVTFTDNGDGTATLAGTPAAGTGGSYPITITANNGVTPNGTQAFTLVIPTPPAPPTITGVTVGNGSATVTWVPGPDGGSPITSYTATATPVMGPGVLHLLVGTLSCTVPAPATSCTINGLVNGTTYTFTVTASNGVGPGNPSNPSTPATPTANGPIPGYWMATASGAVLNFGAAVTYGSPAGLALAKPIVALVPTPDRKGYWLVGSDGGVFSYGDAGFYGSTGNIRLNQPIVGMATTTDGKGYWLVAADGGVFAYGDAGFEGSLGATHLNKPIVGMAATSDGNGYWLVAADGGVFAYGDAAFFGSAGSLKLVSPVVGIAALPNGTGYYLAAADGGVFAYGAAPFKGSAAGVANSAVVGITGGAGGGYTLATSVGGVYTYGAGFFGAQTYPTTAPIIGIAS